MDIEKIPAIITEIQDDIKMLKRAVKANAPAQEVTTELNKEVKVLAQDGTITPLSAVKDTDKWDLEDIDGIIVPLLDGRQVLVYPKFKECKLLPSEEACRNWKAPQLSECEALYYHGDGHEETSELIELKSEAAQWVRTVCKNRPFNLPFNLQILFALGHFKVSFNDLVTHINGADEYNSSFSWSSCRYSTSSAWYCNGYGNASGDYFGYGLAAVPCVLYTERSED